MVFTEVDLIGILHSFKKQSLQVTKISFKLLQKCNFTWLNSLLILLTYRQRIVELVASSIVHYSSVANNTCTISKKFRAECHLCISLSKPFYSYPLIEMVC